MSDDKQSQADDSINLDKLRGCLGRSLTIIAIIVLSVIASCHAKQPYTGPSSQNDHRIAIAMLMLSIGALVGTTLYVKAKSRSK